MGNASNGVLIYADGARGALSGAHTSPRLCGMEVWPASHANRHRHGSVMTLRPASCIMYLWRAAHDGGPGTRRAPLSVARVVSSRPSVVSGVYDRGYTALGPGSDGCPLDCHSRVYIDIRGCKVGVNMSLSSARLNHETGQVARAASSWRGQHRSSRPIRTVSDSASTVFASRLANSHSASTE
jgi:hypothetical protein